MNPDANRSAVGFLGLRHVVITLLDRDDLRDGGAGHFATCVRALPGWTPSTRIGILIPDFRGRMERALDALAADPPGAGGAGTLANQVVASQRDAADPSVG